MGGAGRPRSSWNRGFQAGNLRAEPGPDKGGSWAWGLSLLKLQTRAGKRGSRLIPGLEERFLGIRLPGEIGIRRTL